MTPLESIGAQGELPLAMPEGEAIEREAAEADAAGAPAKVFSGRLVAAREPERYRLFCSLYFDAGLGQMQVCEILRMSPQTGAAIIAAECASRPAADLRARQASRARAVVSLAMSAIQERLSDPEALKGIPLRDLAAVVQRAGEVAQLLDGQATARVEKAVVHGRAPVTEEDVREYMARTAIEGEGSMIG